MSIFVLRRSLLRVSGALLVMPVNGCLGLFKPEQPYGDLVISNNHEQSHNVSVTAVNQLVQAREGEEAATKRFERVIEAQSTVRETDFFVGGETDVAVAVDNTVVEETRVEIWRGEGGDDDRYEESLNVTITQDGVAQVTIDVTHTPSSRNVGA
ncbi:hypothetical protein [Haloarchaeobius sp. TZWSO28]|uniref:hypothetical protein n=1 Tax=Haloarchaeobius sp. TZWSO28 TaxID=3446119 RepID=UPI003EBF414B